VTSTIRLSTLVLDNDFRHPAVRAKELATLDVLCDGRLEVGIGAGWMPADYAVSGIEFERPGRRVGKLAETLTILAATLRGGDPVTVHGEHYTVTELRSIPAPVQRPLPPLLVGGGRPPSTRTRGPGRRHRQRQSRCHRRPGGRRPPGRPSPTPPTRRSAGFGPRRSHGRSFRSCTCSPTGRR